MIYINKNILTALDEGEIDVLCHQENCVSKGYAGIAKHIHKKYPSSLPRDDRRLGEIESTEVEQGKFVVNMYSQYYTGIPNTRAIVFPLVDNFSNRVVALKTCLSKVAQLFPNKKIGLPLIASGLARMVGYEDLSDLEYFKMFIASIVEENLQNVTIYYL